MTTISDCASDVDYIVTSLPNTQIVDAVLNDDGGVFAVASAGTIICDSSTISPIASKEFSETAKKLKMTYLDAPMSGGIMGAEKASLTFMCGSQTPEDFELAKVVLEGMG